MSPGPVSESFRGTPDDAAYVPAYCYQNGPKMCPCGHHEGYHGDNGMCLFRQYDFRKYKPRAHPVCTCTGLPPDCRTPEGEL